MNLEEGKKYRFWFAESKGFTQGAIYTIERIGTTGIYFKGYNLLHFWANIMRITEVE